LTDKIGKLGSDSVDKLESDSAHIIIDCPPALWLQTVDALVPATQLLVPIQSSYFALEGERICSARSRMSGSLRITASDPAT
jgi:cellulose biosynthesis protein BcsQ